MENMIDVCFNPDVIKEMSSNFTESLGHELKEAYDEVQPTMPVALYIGMLTGTLFGFTPRELMSESNSETIDVISSKAHEIMQKMCPEFEEALNNKT